MARNLTVIFWALLLGQVAGYISSALSSYEYNAIPTAILSVVVALLLNFMIPLLNLEKGKTAE